MQGNAAVPGVGEQLAAPALGGGRGEDAADRRVGEQVHIALQRATDHHFAIGFEAFEQRFQGVVEGGEVEAQDDVARAILGGLPADVGAVEDGVPLVGAGAVVVVLQHGHPEALPEAAGTDQECVALLLEPAEKPATPGPWRPDTPDTHRPGCAGACGRSAASNPSGMENACTDHMHDTTGFEDWCDVRVRHGRRRHRCAARAMLTATLRAGPAVVGRAPGRTTTGGAVLVGPVTLTFGGHVAGAPCRFAAAVRWLRLHGAGRGDVVLRDGLSALLVAWPCGAAARRPRSTEGDALRAAIGVPAHLERFSTHGS